MKEKVSVNKITLWQTFTAILGILLIISIFTKGFIGCPSDSGDNNIPSADNNLGAADEEEFNAIFLNDERCPECQIPDLVPQLQEVFPTLNVKEVDYNTEEGKALYANSGLIALPAILFEDNIVSANNYFQVQNYIEQKGDYLSLVIGATFDPEAEICDNEIDDTGDGKTDCEDETCAATLICNKDALVECAEPYGLSSDTIIFYYSNSCPYCQAMKPLVEDLVAQGYDFYLAEGSDAEATEVVINCFGNYLTGSVPQFICPNGQTQVGAFASAEDLKAWADDCVAA